MITLAKTLSSLLEPNTSLWHVSLTAGAEAGCVAAGPFAGWHAVRGAGYTRREAADSVVSNV